MQVALLVALLSAAAFVAAAEEISSVQTVGQPQPQHIQGQLAPVVHSQSGPVGEQAHHAGAFEHHSNDGHPQDHPQHQRIVPAGVIQMVGPQQYSGAGSAGGSGMGPVGISGVQGASGEQYGKPESASIPPNYKPFGSWGLYIGGNPADGYYSNYYKALGSSVEKQQVGGEQTQAIGPVKPQVAAFTPSVRQASGIYSMNGGGGVGGASYAEQVYPFDYYTTADLNSGSRVSMVEQMGGGPSSYAAGSSVLASPAAIGAQVYNTAPMMAYGAPQDSAPMAYVDHYATKRAGSSSSSAAAGAKTQQPYEPHTKGSQQVRYAYVDHQQAPHYASSQAPGQVVAYPVPVGSQIVGSQPGTEGAYAPYGVLGYTRYAVKPTMVANSEQQYYHQGVHSAPSAHFPMYKQQQQQHQPQHQQQQASAAGGAYQPMGFYGYPLNQLHYSQGSIVPASSGPSSSSSVASSGSSSPIVGVHEHQTAGNIMMVPAGTGMIEAAASEKSETIGEIKPAAKETQKNSA